MINLEFLLKHKDVGLKKEREKLILKKKNNDNDHHFIK